MRSCIIKVSEAANRKDTGHEETAEAQVRHGDCEGVCCTQRFTGGAQEIGAFFARCGTAPVVLRHLTGTDLDEAAIRRRDGVNVIALTLKCDRIGNFWFTLLHAFAHVACRLRDETSVIFDELELCSKDGIEAEADGFAQRALIPDELWKGVHADLGTAQVTGIANEAMIHPGIVAGRWQREFGDYRKFSKLVDNGEVRSNFD